MSWTGYITIQGVMSKETDIKALTRDIEDLTGIRINSYDKEFWGDITASYSYAMIETWREQLKKLKKKHKLKIIELNIYFIEEPDLTIEA